MAKDRPSKFKTSSYDRVCNTLMSLPDFAFAESRFRSCLEKIEVQAVRYTREIDYQKNITIVASFMAVCQVTGRKIAMPRYTVERNDADDVDLPLADFVDQDVLRHLVTDNFGKKHCPTFNCKEDKVREKLGKLANQRLEESNRQLVLDTKRRLLDAWREQLAAPEFREKMSRAYDEGVINEIKAVLLRYHEKVGAEVLKEALDQFVAHAILES